jgi:3-deoxy-7-phosphoheptulonate synthase
MTQNPINLVSEPRLDDRTSRTDDEHIVDMVLLPPPEHLIRFFPIQGTPVEALVADTRSRIRKILRGTDDRLLIVVGPCSIHDPVAALDYARHLAVERKRTSDTLEIVMRVYFEKPRTTMGWKGLINAGRCSTSRAGRSSSTRCLPRGRSCRMLPDTRG